MNTFIAKILLVLMAFTLAVPESYAKRMGSGRSAGRQSQMARQKAPPAAPPRTPAAAAPPTPAQPPLQRSQPDVARQAAPPPVAPQVPPPRPASPWRGMLTGALVGLGLGSLMSHAGARDENNAKNTDGASGTNGTGAPESGANATQGVQQEQGHPYRSYLLLGILAFAVFFLVRRARRRRGFLFK